MECTNDSVIPPKRVEILPYRFLLSTLVIITLTIYCSIVSMAHSVFINEFQTTTTQSVELLNLDSNPVNISGWFLDDSGGATYYTIPEGSILSQNQCVVFQTDFNFNTASADIVRLFDSSANPTQAGAILIDSYSYSTPPTLGNSIGRSPDGSGTFAQASASFGLFNSTGLSCTIAPTSTISPTTSPTNTSTPTQTPSPTDSITLPPTPSPSPTNNPTPTVTQSPTPIPTPSETLTPTTTPSPPGTPTFTPIPTVTPTNTPTPSFKENLFISEIFPNPSSGNEWVEIYNGNSFSVTLTNYRIDDIEESGASPQVFSATITAHGFSTIDISGSVFNNDSDFVRLLDENQTEIKMYMYTSTSQNISWGLEEPMNLGIYCLQTSSKGIENNACIEPTTTRTPTVTASPTSTKTTTPMPTATITPTHTTGIYISEILAVTDSNNPKEWIEIYNDNDFAVNIVNWYVGDNSNHDAQVFTADIDPYRFAYIEFSTSRLNNDADTAFLLDSQKNQIDSFSYSETKSGYSWGRKNDDFAVFCLQSPTKNNFNSECASFTTSTPTPSPTHTPTKSPTPTKTPTPTKSVTPKNSPSPTKIINSSSQSIESPKKMSVLGAQNQRLVEHIDYTPKKIEQSSKLTDSEISESDDEFPEDDSHLIKLVTNPYFNLIGLVITSIILGVSVFDLWKQIYGEIKSSQFEDI